MRSMEAYMSAEASLAFKTAPLMKRVVSAISRSGIEGLRSCISSTSARETLWSSSKNLRIRSIFLVAYCSKASVTGMLRPLTATCISPPFGRRLSALSSRWPLTRPAQAQGVDLNCARLLQDRDALAQGGTGREDVVDEEDPACHSPREAYAPATFDRRASAESSTWSLVLRTTFSLSQTGRVILAATLLAMSS